MDKYFWSHKCLLHMKEFVEGKVYIQMGSGADSGISGCEEKEVARARRCLSTWNTLCFCPVSNI